MQLTTIFYGLLKEDTGGKVQTLAFDREALTVGELRALLADRFPALARHLDTVAFAVQDELVSLDYVLTDGDAVALLPPVSGG